MAVPPDLVRWPANDRRARDAKSIQNCLGVEMHQTRAFLSKASKPLGGGARRARYSGVVSAALTKGNSREQRRPSGRFSFAGGVYSASKRRPIRLEQFDGYRSDAATREHPGAGGASAGGQLSYLSQWKCLDSVYGARRRDAYLRSAAPIAYA
jgi:hypothetical protein